MPFTVLLDDTAVSLLGSGADAVWEACQDAKRHGRLRCRDCGGEMRTRVGKNVVRHFFHKTRPDDCLLAGGESPRHLAGKAAVVRAIEASGGVASVEHIAPGRRCVVDVLGIWEVAGRTHRVAFEVQVSPQTEDETAVRNVERAEVADVTVWLLYTNPRRDAMTFPAMPLPGWSDEWANAFPSIRVDGDLEKSGAVAHQSRTSSDGWFSVLWRTTTLDRLVAAVGTGRAVWQPTDHRWGTGGWVTPSLQRVIARERERARRRQAEWEKHQENIAAFVARQQDAHRRLVARLAADGFRPRALPFDDRAAMGMPVRAGNTDYLVLPSSGRIDARSRAHIRQTYVVVADDPDDLRRLRGVDVGPVTVDGAPLPGRLP